MAQRSALATLLALAVLLSAGRASAQAYVDPKGVGLGVAAGVAVPNGTPDFKAALNWGFFVDIPLLDTFHITPSTMLYKLRDAAGNGSSATDVSLNFKFNIPLGRVDIFVGVTAGLTSTVSIDPHAGILGGFTFYLLPNLGLFAQANYKYILRDDNVGGNVRDLQLYAGPIFRF